MPLPLSAHADIFGDLSDAIDATLEAIAVEPRADVRLVLEDVLRTHTRELIETLARQVLEIANVEDRTDRSNWVAVRRRFEQIQRRIALLLPRSPDELRQTLLWMEEQGDPRDLQLLNRLKPDPALDWGARDALQSAIARIAQRIGTTTLENDVTDELNAAVAARNMNGAEWEREYHGEYIALRGGLVVAHAAHRNELLARLADMRRTEGAFRACIIHVGRAMLSARGSLAHGPADMGARGRAR